MLRDNLLRVDVSANIIVIHTLPGTAQGIAFCLDGLAWKESIGTVAGDDTILIVVKTGENPQDLVARIHNLAQ